jgi:uncharacterized protein (TIGR02246 family)
MTEDERAIRKLIEDWLALTQAGDLDAVLRMMADDVVFMVPGREPFGKAGFAASSRVLKNANMQAVGKILEIEVQGTWAFCRTHLRVTMTPPGGKPTRRSGYTLSILRKQADGAWVITRDANLLTPD